MRHLLHAALAAAVLVSSGAVPAQAKQPKEHPRHPRRVRAHLSVHVSTHNVLAGRDLVVHGRLSPSPSGTHRVRVLVGGPAGGRVTATTDRAGAFRVHWGLRNIGVYRVRAFGVHDRRVRGSASVARHVSVYRPAVASYYGPGLYGGALACGGTLEPGTLGVAHKSLPCGTRVTLRYGHRSITVPVVDRGPYVAGREFDLTEATRDRLHFPSTGVVLSTR